MEAQVARAPGQDHGEDVPHLTDHEMLVVEGEGEHAHDHDHDHEKKSVLKKVKDKAKKIKQNLTASNLHHGHVDDDQHHPHASPVDEDDVEDDSEEVIVTEHQIHEVPVQESTVSSAVGGVGHGIEAKPRDNFAHGLGDDAVLGPNLEGDPHAPMGAFDKPHPGNYQSKVSDPTNNDNVEAQVGPLVADLGALKVSDETCRTGPTGSHERFAASSENAPYNDSRNATENRPASYPEKIAAAATAIAGTVVSAKDAVVEKLGYGSKDGQGLQIKSGSEGTDPAPGKIKETLAPVYEKVTGMGTAMASKISGEAAGKEATAEGSSKNSLSGKLRPGDEDRALCEVISNVLHRKKGEAEEAVEHETAKQAGDGGAARSGSGNMVDRIKVAVASLFVKGGDGGAGHGRPPQEDGMEKRAEGRLEETGD